MVRVITQETYDEVVKENMEEFEMSPEEAIKEASAQFEAQGVDLTNIIKDLALGSGDNHLVSITISKLKQYHQEKKSDDELMKEIVVLKAECEKGLAHRVRAGKEGAYDLVIDLLEGKYNMYIQSRDENLTVIIVALLNTLTALMDTQPDLLENRGIDLIKSILDSSKNEDILIATLRWTSTCCMKHEMNRQNLFGKVTCNLKHLLPHQKNRKLLYETLNVIRKFTLDDDIRVEFGKAHDHARELGLLLLEHLADLLKDHRSPPLVSDLMLTIASLLVRNELCASISGSVDVLMSVLTDNYDNVGVVTQAYKLITALAGNDDVKRKLVNSGIAPVVVTLLNRHTSNEKTTALALKCIAALSLREPLHCREFIDAGAPEAVVAAMKVHPESSSVQKNGCWAIRNMVARCRDHNPKFHELGIEAILNQALLKFEKDFGFDIKSALRDLECDVKLVEQWTGKGVHLEK